MHIFRVLGVYFVVELHDSKRQMCLISRNQPVLELKWMEHIRVWVYNILEPTHSFSLFFSLLSFGTSAICPCHTLWLLDTNVDWFGRTHTHAHMNDIQRFERRKLNEKYCEYENLSMLQSNSSSIKEKTSQKSAFINTSIYLFSAFKFFSTPCYFNDNYFKLLWK